MRGGSCWSFSFYVRCSRSVKVWWGFGSVFDIDFDPAGLPPQAAEGLRWVALCLARLLAHGVALHGERDAVTVMHKSIEDGVGDGGFTEVGVPGIDG